MILVVTENSVIVSMEGEEIKQLIDQSDNMMLKAAVPMLKGTVIMTATSKVKICTLGGDDVSCRFEVPIEKIELKTESKT